MKQACDDIISGKAAEIARKAGADPGLFPKSVPWINPTKVSQYIKLQRQIEGEGKWPGPHETTLKGPELKAYLDARNAEVRGLGRLPPKTTRKRKVMEIISAIQPPTDRNTAMRAFEDGYAATRRYQLAQEAIKQIAGIDLDAIIEGAKAPETSPKENLDPRQQRELAALLRRLTDRPTLAEFGLVYDGRRIKMDGGTGATLISKDAMETLLAIAGLTLELPPPEA
jgi:hypothetical protein